MFTNCLRLGACTHLSSTVSQLFELQVQRIAVFTYCSPHFCFPWRRLCDYHAICCMDGKKIQCLLNPSQHVPIYIFNSFRVIQCLSQCVSPKITIFTTFLFPLGTRAITLNVVWMEREFNAYKLSRCICPSNYYRFWDTARYLWKNRHFIIPPCIRRPRYGGSRRNIGTPLRRKN